MNAGIAFISRKSRKTDVAWRYAIAVVLVVCCIGPRICGDCCGAVVYQ